MSSWLTALIDVRGWAFIHNLPVVLHKSVRIHHKLKDVHVWEKVPKKIHAKPLWQQKVKLPDIFSMVGAGSRGWCITVLCSRRGESEVNGFPLLRVTVFVIPLQTSAYEEYCHFSHTSQRGWDVFSSHRRGVCDSHLSFRAIRAPVFLFPGATSDISPSSEIPHRFTKFAEMSGLAFTLFSRICLPSARFWEFSSSLLVVSQNSRVPPPKCWSGPEAVPLHSKKKKKTSRNARFLEWLWPRMRQHSHGRDSCTCRLLPQFLFQRRVDCARSGFEVELLFLVIL